MLAVEREKKILDYLSENHVATTQSLCDLTDASLATIRRDLNTLSERGLLLRTHGGAQVISHTETPAAVSSVSGGNDVISGLTLPDYINTPQYQYKNAIAAKAVDFIHSNDIVFIGAGVTCTLLCRHLNNSNRKNVTVVTTNITGVLELARNPRITTFLLGGTVHRVTNHIETLDDYTLQSLSKLFFDKAFFTVDGIDLYNGYSIINHAQLQLFHYLLENTSKIYMLASEGKYDKRTFTYLCDLDAIPYVIANECIRDEYRNYYQTHGVTLYTT